MKTDVVLTGYDEMKMRSIYEIAFFEFPSKRFLFFFLAASANALSLQKGCEMKSKLHNDFFTDLIINKINMSRIIQCKYINITQLLFLKSCFYCFFVTLDDRIFKMNITKHYDNRLLLLCFR